MTRTILGLLVLPLLAALPAAAQQRPSIASVDAAQKRTNTAICAKADADGDSYRPFVCTPRCGCFEELFAQGNTPSSCQESSAGVFDISFLTAPGTCNNGSCSYSSLAQCTVNLPLCPAGETCVSAPNPFGLPFAFCRRLCSSNAGCPAIPAAQTQLSGVTDPDGPSAVDCTPGFNEPVQKINSNDAIECLRQVEAATGPCQ